ncbi:MAG TPA: nucleotide-binding protein [Polyangiaceae bacterium]|jgi:predicted nucleotide-binding protein|nr:nucleotide-binding protein [Polyangiaceae bacterium]
MDDLLDDLIWAARKCELAARTFKEGRFLELRESVQEQVKTAHRAWSGSFIGYHARVYIENFQPRLPNELFDAEWGLQQAMSSGTRGRWLRVDAETAKQELLDQANVSPADMAFLERTAKHGRDVFRDVRAELLPTIDAAVASKSDKVLEEKRRAIAGLVDSASERDFLLLNLPKQFATRDSTAASEGVRYAPHLELEARILALASIGAQLKRLAEHASYVATYLQKAMKLKGKTVAKADGKIFIGHGRSPTWRELKDFIQDRLGLVPDEFSRESTAGLSTKERLQTMLDQASFAFLVMTSEDEKTDGTKVARANVIHEVGLFQGRLGFERAIILLEEGCEEFSNIAGVSQLRFAPGKIAATFEHVRQVLEREKIL